jgi:hypothetical protein
MSDAESTPTKRAIIIGINDYKDASVPQLNGAVNDASDIFDRLSDPEIGGYQIPAEHKLIGADATCNRIRKAISDVFYKTDFSSDLAIFYFSGHGIEDSYREGYLVPYDMTLENPFVQGIRMNELRQVMTNSVRMGHVKAAIAILDCCYSGIATKNTKGFVKPKISFCDHFKDGTDASCEGMAVLASSGEEETSKELEFINHDDGGPSHAHGLFTSILIEALDGNASDEYGRICLPSLNDYLAMKLQEKGAQKSYLTVEQINKLGSWEIAKCPQKRNQKMLQLLEEAQESYKTGNPTCIVIAAANTANILQMSPKHKDAESLKELIEYYINVNQEKTNVWLVENELLVCPKIPILFDEFSKLAGLRKVEEIKRLTKEQGTLLANLWRVSSGQLEVKEFIVKCKYIESLRSASAQVMPKILETVNNKNTGNTALPLNTLRR